MKCINCNNEIEDTALFCKYCGTKVVKVEEQEKEPTVDSGETGEDTNDAAEVKTESNNTPETENKDSKPKKKVNIKGIVIGVLVFLVLLGIGCYVYHRYISTVISADINQRDYKIINNQVLAYNYSGNLQTGELYLADSNKGTKIADSVAVDTYHINPTREFVIYSVKSGDNNKSFIYKDGKSQEFNGEFYKFTEDGQYMLYVTDNKLSAYDCDTGESRKIGTADSAQSGWLYQYDDVNKTIYVCLGENKRLYSLNFANEEAESIVSDVEKFEVFGTNAYGYKKSGSSHYMIKTQNAEEELELEFSDVMDIQSSQDGETILFTATRDEGVEKEYALYIMVEGIKEPIRLLSGPVYKFEYKEASNKVYLFREDSLYSIDLTARTIQNKNDKELYYNSFNDCEPVKIESEITDFRISPDGKNIAAIKPSSADDNDDTTEAATSTENGVAKSVDAGFLSVVYADEVTTVATTTSQPAAQDKKTSDSQMSQSATQAAVQTTEAQTETTTEERKVGATVELVVIIGEEKKTIDVADSSALCDQYLGLGNNTLVYPLAVNGKVELHIVKNINKALSDIEDNDEVICTNTGLFNYDNIFDEFAYFDKNATTFVKYENYKASKADKAMEYDLIYLDANKAFGSSKLAYKKLPDYNNFVGKYKISGGDSVLNNLVIEFTGDKKLNVYSIGELKGSCGFSIKESDSNKTSLRINPQTGSSFSANCNPYYNHQDYTNSLLPRVLMTDSSLIIQDFDGKMKYKVDYKTVVNIEKLSDENFNSAIAAQKSTHNQNLTKLRNEKAAAEAAAAAEARREQLESLAYDYYFGGVYVTSSETLYSWHGYGYSTTYTYNNSHFANVYDYYIDYNSGDIWLNTGGNPLDAWVVR